MQITEQQKQNIINLIHLTWQQIYPDVAPLFEGEISIPREEVAELTLDADRYKMVNAASALHPLCLAEAQRLVPELVDNHGWTLGDFAALLPHKRYDVQ